MNSKIKTIAFLCILALWSCNKDEVYNKKQKQKYDGPTAQFEQVHTIYSEDGKLKIKLDAPLQVVSQTGDIEYPKGISLSMYNPLGVKTTTMRADKGKFLKEKEMYQGTGNVVVVNMEQKQTLYTDELNWNQPKREIFTEKPIKIVTENEILNGIGLTSNEDFSKYSIKKPTGVFVIAK